MKKIILTLCLVATFSTAFVSCSTDDSGLENDTNATEIRATPSVLDNGNRDLPKPPQRV
ncbi:hypothetical protein [Flavobacterium cyanobacteriorum]|uniref:hypothetical protein n=1 Tax=Flavobacterium cyanobacteriorum TaxID=2022802 RepID=UPI0013FDDC5E|nr:hypothetical protein [Flavobacterium cyanobacteriorum]